MPPARPSGDDRTTPFPTVSVVIPARNEERNLPYVFARLPRDVDEVILVDGGSGDRTVERARELWPSIRIVRQTRAGKGNALVCGFAAATGDIIVMIDADGSTDPAELPNFVDPLRAGADFAKGSRFRDGGGSTDITPLRRLGNRLLNGIVNMLFGVRFTDLCYGYNAFWRRVVPELRLPDPASPCPSGGKRWGDGFEIETLMNIRVATAGLRIQEVPSIEHPRRHGESNLRTFRDGARVLRTILREFRRYVSDRYLAVGARRRAEATGRPEATRTLNPAESVTRAVEPVTAAAWTAAQAGTTTVIPVPQGPAAAPETAARRPAEVGVLPTGAKQPEVS